MNFIVYAIFLFLYKANNYSTHNFNNLEKTGICFIFLYFFSNLLEKETYSKTDLLFLIMAMLNYCWRVIQIVLYFKL